MPNIYFDSALSDEERRERLYSGDLFSYSPTPATRELVSFAAGLIRDAFSPRDPEKAQFDMDVSEFAAVLAELKPSFIHHPQCKRLIPAVLRDLGCDLDQTYFDVPRMRSSTSHDYLTSGIAYAFHPHRDTWYSAPMCQVNWWMPIFPIEATNCMAFHPAYWARAVANTSHNYNYQEWNRVGRAVAASQIGSDTREQPKASVPLLLEPDVRLLPPPGGVIVFSAAQLHSSVPNTSGRTRFSIDFRTVNVRDAADLKGAPNVDSFCSGTTMGDYKRCSDLSELPERASAPYRDGPPKKPSAMP